MSVSTESNKIILGIYSIKYKPIMIHQVVSQKAFSMLHGLHIINDMIIGENNFNIKNRVMTKRLR